MCTRENTRSFRGICDPLEILRCVMGLSTLEVKAYRVLLKEGPLSVKEIAERLGCSRPSAQKALSRLLNLKIVHRSKVLRREGGYVFIYQAIPLEKVKDECIRLILKLSHIIAKKREQLIELKEG